MSNTINAVFHTDFVHALGIDGGEACADTLQKFLDKYLPLKIAMQVNTSIQADTDMFRANDPASSHYSLEQILSVRRGMAAIAAHRIFSAFLALQKFSLYELEVLAKFIQKDTNVEIHPQATIGKCFAIDHGHGTVIGSTAIVGENVWIYHGVTLGATGKVNRHGRRHPKIGDNCFFGNGSQVLGPSDLGENVSLASGSIIANSCPSNGVSVSLGVKISGVIIPPNTKVFSAHPENSRRYWTQTKGQKILEWKEFEKWEVE